MPQPVPQPATAFVAVATLMIVIMPVVVIVPMVGVLVVGHRGTSSERRLARDPVTVRLPIRLGMRQHG
jgi:hypothetical protein